MPPDTLTEVTLTGTIRYVILGAVRERVVWRILVDALLPAAGCSAVGCEKSA